MKPWFIVIALAIAPLAYGQDTKAPPTLKSILLEQLRSTHNVKEWFVPANTALAGLTAEQADWKDRGGNHSVRELANHLIFWDERSLVQFKGGKPPKFDGNNEETFKSPQSWDATVRKLDEVLSDWEKAIEAADDSTLRKWYSTIAHVGTHNAYHIGEIVYVRREQGCWNPENGVH
ncbi:MAG TPA: DinB family protein [Bryobacteraceae bacterium]|jgi:uncharacterized damage-inducible protein DinB